MRASLSFALIVGMGCVGVHAASLPATTEAQVAAIHVGGTGEVTIKPDRVDLTISVENSASSTAAAAAATARIHQAVLEALTAAGAPSSEISSDTYEVSPTWRYQDGSAPKRIGYSATQSTVIDTTHLDRVGAYIDAALSAGATRVDDPNFTASGEDDARQQALTQAVDKARRDADTLAHAAGGSLGRLLSLGTDSRRSFEGAQELDEVVVTATRRARVATVIGPGELTISATAYASWEFLPAR